MLPIAYADSSAAEVAAQCLVDKINNVFLFPLIGLLAALAFLYFLYGAFEYVRNADNDTARETGQRHLLYGVVGFLVMVSAYALLSIAAGSFGFGLKKVNCNDNSNPSAINNLTAPLAPGGGSFTGGLGQGVDTTPTGPGGDTIPSTPTQPSVPGGSTPDAPPAGSNCVIEDRVQMYSCGNDPNCEIAINNCKNHYDIQSVGETGGLPQIIRPGNNSVNWQVECTYSVAVCS